MVSNIWVASADNDINLVKKYIESGEFNANSKDINGYTPIHAAVSYGHLELLNYLISECQGDINIQDNEGDTPLHHVEDIKVAKYLIEILKANHKLKNNDDLTPLQYLEEDDEFPELITYLRSLEFDHDQALNSSPSPLPELPSNQQVRYTYELPPSEEEINLTTGLTQEERELKLKEIAESDNPEELLRDLVKNAVHQHLNSGGVQEDQENSNKKRKNN